MIRLSRLFLLAPLLLILVVSLPFPLAAQDDCPVVDAYEIVETMCTDTERGEACYGNTLIEARLYGSRDDFHFETPGDTVDLAAIQNMRLTPLDNETGEWGISLMYVDAVDVEGSSPQPVQLVIFGNVEIENNVSVTPPEPVSIEIAAQDMINIRAAPSTSGEVVGVLSYNETATANGRNEMGDWLRITIPESTDTGWVYAPLVLVDGEVDMLLVIDPNAVTYGPMQSFMYRSQLNDSPCDAAPDSGILIQTPQGVGEITLLINEVVIELGSTSYIQAQPGKEMIVTTLEGEVIVSAVSDSVTTPQGALTRIPLDNQGIPEEPPSAAEPFQADALQQLPIQLLDRPVPITSNVNFYTINFCEAADEPLQEGQTVFINYGIGRWATPEEAASVLEGHTASITVDGMPLDTNYDGILLHGEGEPDAGYGKRGLATWVATSGTHTMRGAWTLNNASVTCTLTVE